MFVQGEGCLLTFTLYHSHPGIWYMNRFLLTHFLTCTFISMSTSISKGCHGHVCWGKPNTTGYGNGSTDLPGTYYSSDAPLMSPIQYSNPAHFASKLQCPRVRTYMVQPFLICLVYFVMKKVKHGRSIVMGHTS